MATRLIEFDIVDFNRSKSKVRELLSVFEPFWRHWLVGEKFEDPREWRLSAKSAKKFKFEKTCVKPHESGSYT